MEAVPRNEGFHASVVKGLSESKLRTISAGQTVTLTGTVTEIHVTEPFVVKVYVQDASIE